MAFELDTQAVILCSSVLAFLPITTWALWLVSHFFMRKVRAKSQVKSKQHDTMQRNGNKGSQNNCNNVKQQNQQQSHHRYHTGKNDSSGSQQSSPNHSNRSRKSRTINNNPNHNNNNNNYNQQQNNNSHNQSTQPSPGKKQLQHDNEHKQHALTYPVNDWLETQTYYGRRFMSTAGEDNRMSRHNGGVHRNSTSSDTTASDDLNSCTSNEDLNEVYTVLPKTEHKKSNKQARGANNANNNNNNHNKRQTKRKQPFSPNNLNNNNNNAIINNGNKYNNGNIQQRVQAEKQKPVELKQRTLMDVDDDVKENEIPISSNIKDENSKQNNAVINNNGNNNVETVNKLKTNKKRGKNNRTQTNDNNGSIIKSSSNSSVYSAVSVTAISNASDDASNSSSCSANNSVTNSPTTSPVAQKRSVESIKKIVRALVPKYIAAPIVPGLAVSEPELHAILRPYLVSANLLRVYGYPIESVLHEGCVEVYKCLPRPAMHKLRQPTSSGGVINSRDGLFSKSAEQNLPVCAMQNRDSGQGSSDSSPPSLDSDSCEVTEDEPTTTEVAACYTPDGSYQIFSQYDQSLEKQCVRCKSVFHVTEAGQYVSREECVFHWGKMYQLYTGNQTMSHMYTCCNQVGTTAGCSRNQLHVWTGAVVGLNGPYTDFMHTRVRYNEDGSIRRSHKVYALDCEMSFTGHGLDVTKVTVIGVEGNIVYEKYVLPSAEIADYNTRFSGVTEQDLCPQSNSELTSLPQVQRDLLEIIDADSILIGHGLDNDLRALRIVHKTIVDTSVVFPHTSGFPYRRSLKHLARSYLGRTIQNSEDGHSSYEDSLACLHLMLLKIQLDQDRPDMEE